MAVVCAIVAGFVLGQAAQEAPLAHFFFAALTDTSHVVAAADKLTPLAAVGTGFEAKSRRVLRCFHFFF